MKMRWLSGIAYAGVITALAAGGVHAQDRDRDRDRYDQGGGDRRDQGRDADQHRHFDDRDRQVLNDWYRDHSDQLEQARNGDRRDDADIERRLQNGNQLDPDMRRWSRPVPQDLASRLGPLPQYWRYVMLGYHLCIVDDNWTIRDVYHFDQFSDRDRDAVTEWNRNHTSAVNQILGGFGVHVDQGDLDRRLQVGATVDNDLQGRARPAREDLTSRLSVPPRGWRYVVIGDRLCLVDRDWRVHESFHFQH